MGWSKAAPWVRRSRKGFRRWLLIAHGNLRALGNLPVALDSLSALGPSLICTVSKPFAVLLHQVHVFQFFVTSSPRPLAAVTR